MIINKIASLKENFSYFLKNLTYNSLGVVDHPGPMRIVQLLLKIKENKIK
jgi:hypothetical protein